MKKPRGAFFLSSSWSVKNTDESHKQDYNSIKKKG